MNCGLKQPSETAAPPDETAPPAALGGSGGVVTKYYFFGGRRVALRRGGVVQYLLGDHLGSTSLVLDANGAKVAEARYYPYGETRWTAGTLPTDYRFTGQREEASLGLYQMGARWVDPSLGRWLSADTIVPGAAVSSGGSAATLGYDDQVRLTPLTVGFHETQFLSVVGEENRDAIPVMWDCSR
jgi:RHS repeat-associated protein